MTAPDQTRCSDTRPEPLPGSAKQESLYLLYEHPYGWSHDILDGDTFGPALTAQLTAFLHGRAGLQLIRHPGREGRRVDRPRLFLVFAGEGHTELLHVDGPEEILGLDLSGPGRNGAEVVEEPLLLVCTHGKRDVCCAVKGRPLAQKLADSVRGTSHHPLVWETSHTKGHRFAPSLLLMPWGYSFGRLNTAAATTLLAQARAGAYFLPGNRGRGLYSPRGQVAEVAVAARLLAAGEPLGYGQLHAEDNQVTHADGRTWTVALRQREAEGIISSCGDEPKQGMVWEADAVHAD